MDQIDNFVNTDHAELILYIQDTSTNEVINTTVLDLNTTIVSIHDHEFDGIFEMYPNPANDELTIELEGVNFDGDASIRFINSFGQVAYEKVRNINGEYDRLQFNLSDLSSGIYLVQLNFGDKKVFTEKIVIVR